MGRHSKRLAVSTPVKPGDVLPKDVSERDGPTFVVTRKVRVPEPKGSGPFFEERLKLYHASDKTRDVRVPVWPKFKEAPAHVIADLVSKKTDAPMSSTAWDDEIARLCVRMLEEDPRVVLASSSTVLVQSAHREGYLSKGRLTDEGRAYALERKDEIAPVERSSGKECRLPAAYERCSVCGTALLSEHRGPHARHHDQWSAFQAYWTEPGTRWATIHRRLWTVGLARMAEDPIALLAVLGEQNQPLNPQPEDST